MTKKNLRIDQPLVSLEIELQYARFNFKSTTVEFSTFYLSRPSCADVYFDLWERKGDLNLLWSLIDVAAGSALVDEKAFILHFENGVELRHANNFKHPEQVNVFGHNSDGVVITRYPADMI